MMAIAVNEKMLKVHTQKLGEVTIFHPQGRLVTGETDVLLNAVLSQSDANLVVLDLERVKDIDARGLGLLLQLREQTQSKGIDFRLKNVSDLVLQLLEITCLDTVFDVSSEADAFPKASRVQPGTPAESSTGWEV